MRCTFWAAAAACMAALAPRAEASFQCSLAGSPALITKGGLAEPVGDIVLACSGAPGQSARLTLGVWLDRTVSNAPASLGDGVTGVGLWLDSDSPPRLLTTLARLQGAVLYFETVTVTANSSGSLLLRVSGVRAEAGDIVRAGVLVLADVTFLLANFSVVVGVPNAGLLATALDAAACWAGPPLPQTLDWPGVLAQQPWTGAVRISEGFSSSFRPMDPFTPGGGATRILVRLEGLPPGSRVFAPDGVAGSNAVQPTRSGRFGQPAQPGMYLSGPPRSLLLGRVAQADSNGAGGTAVLGLSPASLTGVGEAEVRQTEAWLVYEVLDADPSALETAEIPLWIFTPVSRVNEPVIVRIRAMLAPLSDQAGPVAGAPVPRYQLVPPLPDCSLLGDCGASYFPALEVVPSVTTEFAAASGGKAISAALFVRNRGGHFVEWKASVKYLDGDGWIVLQGTGGLSEGSFYYLLDPKELSPGEYRAEIRFDQLNSPTGNNAIIVIPVRLVVTAGPPAPPPPPQNPPAPPKPEIWSALSVPSDVAGPLAPGGLMRLTGRFFVPETSVTVAGLAARVLDAQPDSLLVEIPVETGPGPAEVVAANEGQAGEPFRIHLLPAAPSVVSVLHADGEANSEAAPAAAGSEVRLVVTGIARADEPAWVNIHDRWSEARREPGGAPGVHTLRVVIAEDLPAMMTAVRVCVTAAGIDSICSHPRPIWIATP